MTDTCYTYCNVTETKPVIKCWCCREEVADYEYWNGWEWVGVCSGCGRNIMELDGNMQNLRQKKLEAK